MRNVILMLLVVLLSGCGLPLRSDIVINPPAKLEPTVGMTRVEVQALMNRRVTIGYEVDPVSGASKPVEVQNLYSSEKILVSGQEYWVDSYITGVPTSGGPVSRDMLTPMIFKDNTLAGKGREALVALTASHEK